MLLGYQTVRSGEHVSLVWKKRRTLAVYARNNGFRLGRVFVHEEARGRSGALGALLRAAAHPQVTTVAVLSETDLGESPRLRAVIRGRLETVAGVRIVVVGR